MTAKEKKDIILKLLSETTYNLNDDFSVIINHYKFDCEEVHVDEYRLTFYPNHANCWMEDAVKTILSTIELTGCWATIRCVNEVPVIYAVVK